MDIISGTIDFNIPDDTVLTIGKFDGIHNGHLLILERMKTYRASGLKLCVMTFDIPPATIGFGKDSDVLMTMGEKRQVFNRFGDIDYLVEFPFTQETAAISPERFIEEYIVGKMHAKAVVVGSDCSFGHKALGNADMLRKYSEKFGYSLEVVNKVMDGDTEISSTYVRRIVREGNVAKADSLSFRPFFINGKFRRGASDFSSGIMMYYMDIAGGKVIPDSGIYFSKVLYEDSFYPALTCVNYDERTLETYVYGGVKGIASGEVSIALFEKKRDIMEFTDVNEKNAQARIDIFDGEKWHKLHPRN